MAVGVWIAELRPVRHEVHGDEADRGEQPDHAGELRRIGRAARDEYERHEDGDRTEQAWKRAAERQLRRRRLAHRVVGDVHDEQDGEGRVRDQEAAHEDHYGSGAPVDACATSHL